MPRAHIPAPARDLLPGTGPAVLDTSVGRLGVSISWEGFFEHRTRDAARAEALACELGGDAVASDAIMGVSCDVFSPNALGAILDDEGIARLDCKIVAGGANNQLARAAHGPVLAQRGILYAPDYVINAGGIIIVCAEYFRDADRPTIDARIDAIGTILRITM